jgi:hypothetical protein
MLKRVDKTSGPDGPLTTGRPEVSSGGLWMRRGQWRFRRRVSGRGSFAATDVERRARARVTRSSKDRSLRRAVAGVLFIVLGLLSATAFASYIATSSTTSASTEAESTGTDSTAPAISVSHTANGSNGWNTSSPVTVSVAATDSQYATEVLADGPFAYWRLGERSGDGTGNWAATVSLPGFPYYSQGAAPLAPGKALIVGGYNNCCYGAVNWARIFGDGGGGSFTDAAPLWKDLNAPAAAPLGEGKVLEAGGQETHGSGGPDYADAYVYDAASNTWTQTGSMAGPRFAAAAAPIDTSGTGVFGNGDALIVGGASRTVSGSLSTVELYHDGTFRTKAPLPIGLDGAAAASLGDGRVLVAGGDHDGVAEAGAYIYDPAADSWSAVASMSTPRIAAGAFPLGDAKVLVAGGTCACGGDYNTALSSTEVYDADTNTWSPGSTLSDGRRNFAGAALGDGHLLAAGGLVTGGTDTTSSILYSSAADASGNGHAGTYVGGPTLGVDGAVDGDTAVSFDGASQYASIPSFDITSAITVEAWAKPAVSGETAKIVGKHGSSNPIAGTLGIFEGSPEFEITTGGDYHSVLDSSALPVGSWSHVVGTYDGSTVTLYVDGNEVASTPASGAIATNSCDWDIGALGCESINLFDGAIDEAAVYDHALTEDRISSHYAAAAPSGLAGPPTCTDNGSAVTVTGTSSPYSLSISGEGTHAIDCSATDNAGNTGTASDSVKIDTVNPAVSVSHTADGSTVSVAAVDPEYATDVLADAPSAYWRLGEASGPSAADASGNGHTGTYVGGPTLGVAGAVGGDTAASFDGSSQYVSIPGFDISSAITVEAWVEPAAGGETAKIVGKHGSSNPIAGTLGVFEGSPEFEITTGGDYHSVFGGSTLPVGSWSHVVGTYDGSTVILYVDGSEVASTPASGAIATNSCNWDIGALGCESINLFDGAIDEAAVYDHALTSDRVLSHYLSAPSSGPASGLAGPPTCTDNGSAVTVSGSSSPYSLSITDEGTHSIDCSATDNAGNTGTGSDTVDIEANQAPTANAGGPYSGKEGDAIPLDGSGSSDPDAGDTLTYAWSGPDACSFSDSTAEQPTVTCDDNGTYTVSLTVTDSHGASSDPATANVLVANVAPTATLGDNGPVDEGSPVTISFTDPSDPSSADTNAGFHYAFACTSTLTPSDPPGFDGAWGSGGSDAGQFYGQQGISVAPNGNVYVADTGNNRIEEFDGAGGFIRQWGEAGSDPGQFANPNTVAVGPDGSVYVSDNFNNRVQEFTANGTFVREWGSLGSGDGEFDSVPAVAVGPDGSVYVVDYNNHRVQKFTADGEYVTQWGTEGNGDGKFERPQVIAVGPDGSVYVGDEGTLEIQKFTSDGSFVTKWGGSGTGDGQFGVIWQLDTGPDGSVYASDGDGERVEKFTPDGDFVTKWGTPGSGDGQFDGVFGIGITPDNKTFYVVDYNNARVEKFTSSPLAGATYDGSGSDASTTCTFPDNGRYTVYGRIIDKDGGYTEYTTDVTVDNVNPTVTAPADQTATADEATSFDLGSFTDPGADSPWSVDVDWGDGSDHGAASATSAGSLDAMSHTYADAGSYQVTVTVTDKDGGFDIASFTVTVGTSDPSVIAPSDQSATEGDSTSFELGSFSDPGADNPWTVDVNWGDGSGHTTFATSSTGLLAPQAHSYDDNGSYTITVTVTDKDGGSGSAQFTIAAANAAPSATLGNGGPVDEGSPATVTFSAPSDPSSADTGAGLHYAFACNVSSTPTFARAWGSIGTGNGQFGYPIGIAVGPDGSVYVADYDNNRIDKFTAAGDFVAKWGTLGSGDGQFRDPGGVAVGPDGSVYVADTFNNRIQKFSATGDFLAKWGGLNQPYGVGVGRDGSVYVADTSNHQIQRFTADGTFVARWGSLGIDEGQFQLPSAVAVGPDGSVYVADQDNNRIQKFTADGSFVLAWGGAGSGDGQLQYPFGVAVGSDGSVYVADTSNHRIEKFTADGAFVTGWGSYGSGDGQFNYPYGVAVGSGGVYVSDTYNRRIERFLTSPLQAATYASSGTAASTSCTFPDNGTYKVAGRIIDKDGGYSEYTTDVTVDNVNPSVTAPTDQTASEGSTASFDLGSFTDPGPDSPWTVDVDWGDGSDHGTATMTSTGSLGSLDHTYADSGSYQATVTVTDKDGGAGTATFNVTVANVGPTATLGNGGPGNEGSPIAVSFTGQSDPSSVDTANGFHYVFDCSGGPISTFTYATAPPVASTSCTFDDGPSTHTVSGRIIDKDGGSSYYTTSVVVNNVPPTATLGNNGPVNEGSPATISFSAQSDPSTADTNAGFHYAYDCTGGANTAATYATASTSASTTCTFNDGPSDRTVAGWIVDKDGGSTRATTTVHVNNVPPTVTAAASQTATEGTNKSFNIGSFTDPGAEGANGWTLDIDWGDGSRASTTLSSTGTIPAQTHTYDDGPSTRTVTLKVTDKDGGSNSKTFTVTVGNVAPTASLGNNGPVNEASAATISFSGQLDPSGADTTAGFRYAYDCTGGTTTTATYANASTSASSTCSYDDGPANKTVAGWIFDKDGGVTRYTTTVVVNNVAPTAALGNNGPINEGGTATISFSGQSDPSTADTTAGFHYAYDCTGGATTGLNYGNASTSPTSTCTFTDGPADKTVAGWIFDKNGGKTRVTTVVHVNNVPPTVTAPASQTATEGSAKSFTLGSFTDPGAEGNGGWTVDVDWGDGPTHTTFALNATGTITAQTHTYDDGPATRTVTVKVTDKNGGTDSRTFTVAVANVNPTATFGGPTTGIWGVGYTFSFSAQADPSGADRTAGFHYAYDCNGGSLVSAGSGTSASTVCNYTAPGSYTVRARIIDKDGGFSEYTRAITIAKRTTTLVYSGDLSRQYSDLASLKAKLTDQTGAGVPNRMVKFTIGTQSATAATGTDGVASTTLQLTQANASYAVVTSFDASLDSLYTGSTDSDAFTITQEDARAGYSGSMLVFTASPTSTSATVTLTATIKDITAVSGDPAYDPSGGDIRNAKVDLVNRDSNSAAFTNCSNLSVTLVDPNDPTVGTVSCTTTLAASSMTGGTAYTVGIVVKGYYSRNSADDNTVVNLAQPLSTNFVTGGGFLVNSSSSGIGAGTAGLKTNFGFNVKRSGTTLTGNLDTIVRSGGHVYQIKSTGITSFVENVSGSPATATVAGKATIVDITNPAKLITIDNAATYQLALHDYGDPGTSDTIGITVNNKAGALWFSSNWNGTATVEQVLAGGNLSAR